MIINYSSENVLMGKKSIFLAGPTPRSLDVETWRKDAIKILEELGFDGIVYVPEREVDDRTFDYDNQVWWEREALYNADIIVFWVPRSINELPGFTTNVEFGYWISKDSSKVIYGRPDNSVKNRYLDWLYYTETRKQPINNLKDLLKGAIEMVKEKNNKGSYELTVIRDIIDKYPEIMNLVGEVQFTPESYGVDSEKTTYGKMLFKDVDANQLKEFDRTILSVLLYFYVRDNKYDKFVEQQKGDNKLSRESFDEIRNFLLANFDTKEKEDLLLYYIVINDLGKSQRMVDILKNSGIETIDHDMVLKYLLMYNMLPSLNGFSDESKTNLINVLENGINFGQFIQGECVDYSFERLGNLSSFEKILMGMEAMVDIGGVLGHINNQNGSVILNQSTADNFMTAFKILTSSVDSSKIFGEFLSRKADKMQISSQDADVRKAITRICLMMRLSNKNDIQVVEDEILNNLDKYKVLIYEFNQGGYDNKPGILLYYSPALLSNALSYFKKGNCDNPIRCALNCCLPFMQDVLFQIRATMNKEENGVITVMLRDAALTASVDPTNLNSFEVNVLGSDEATLKRKLEK